MSTHQPVGRRQAVEEAIQRARRDLPWQEHPDAIAAAVDAAVDRAVYEWSIDDRNWELSPRVANWPEVIRESITAYFSRQAELAAAGLL